MSLKRREAATAIAMLPFFGLFSSHSLAAASATDVAKKIYEAADTFSEILGRFSTAMTHLEAASSGHSTPAWGDGPINKEVIEANIDAIAKMARNLPMPDSLSLAPFPSLNSGMTHTQVRELMRASTSNLLQAKYQLDEITALIKQYKTVITSIDKLIQNMDTLASRLMPLLSLTSLPIQLPGYLKDLGFLPVDLDLNGQYAETLNKASYGVDEKQRYAVSKLADGKSVIITRARLVLDALRIEKTRLKKLHEEYQKQVDEASFAQNRANELLDDLQKMKTEVNSLLASKVAAQSTESQASGLLSQASRAYSDAVAGESAAREEAIRTYRCSAGYDWVNCTNPDHQIQKDNQVYGYVTPAERLTKNAREQVASARESLRRAQQALSEAEAILRSRTTALNQSTEVWRKANVEASRLNDLAVEARNSSRVDLYWQANDADSANADALLKEVS